VRFVALRPIRLDLSGLGETIRAARYRVEAPEGVAVDERIAAFRDRPRVLLRRQTKRGRVHTFDLARELLALEALGSNEARMVLRLNGDGASLRPDEVLREVLGEAVRARVVREDLLVDWNGRLVDPLLAASASDVVRASR
jgi:hypothetical protein